MTQRIWIVFLEEADGDGQAQAIGSVEAATMSEALDLAAQKYEIPSHDLVVRLGEQIHLS